MSKLLREDKSDKPDFTYIAEMYPTFSRIMKQLMMGEKKYARLNWRNCKDPLTYKQSASRHLLQYINGQDDEDHLIASVVNLLILADLEEHGVR
jgi:Domain of unknown function (DUF5664)